MLIAVFPVLVAVAGLLLWVLASHPKASEAGKLLFFAGALIATWSLAGHVVHIG